MTNEIIQNIKTRRSIRNFKDKKIEKEILEEIIQAGKYAPSAINQQPWKFIVITNKEFMQKLTTSVKGELKNILKKRYIKSFKIKELKDRQIQKHIFAFAFSEEDIIFFNAPALILVLTQTKMFYDESCACCAQNMMLAAHSLGIGSCWIGFASALGLNKEIMNEIGIPENHHISAAIIFGYPDEQIKRPSIRKIQSDIIKWI